MNRQVVPWVVAAAAVAFALGLLVQSCVQRQPVGLTPAPVQPIATAPVAAALPTPVTAASGKAKQQVPRSGEAADSAALALERAQGPDAALAEGPVAVKGAVTTTDEKPIAGAIISLTYGGAAARTARTQSNAKGEFLMRGITASVADLIRIEARGFSPQMVKDVPLPMDDFVVSLDAGTGAELRIRRQGAVGRILPFDGTAELFTYAVPPEQAGTTAPLRLVSRLATEIVNGRQLLDNLPVGRYRFGVRSGSEYVESQSEELTTGAANAPVFQATFGGPQRLTGKVLARQPLPGGGLAEQPIGLGGVLVTLVSQGRALAGLDPAKWQMLSEPDGAFALPEVPPGTYALELRAQGYLPKVLPEVLIEPGDVPPPPATLELKPEAAALIVRVVNVDGRPVGGAPVSVVALPPAPRTEDDLAPGPGPAAPPQPGVSGPSPEPAPRTAQTLGDGSVRIAKLDNRRYEVTAVVPGVRGRQKSVVVDMGEPGEQEVTIRFDRTVTISGNVRRSGRPFVGRLQFFRRGEVTLAAQVTTDIQGRFAVQVPSGEYQVAGTVAGSATKPNIITVPPTDLATVDFELP